MKHCNNIQGRNYILITSAYNEEEFIGKTIESVLKQTVLPVCWIIISDGSIDKTDDIIQEYATENPFIIYLRRSVEDKIGHDFASKVFALNSALSTIDYNDYDFLGILDADILLPENYYEILINRMEENEDYGVLGGMIYETINGKLVKHDISLNTVCGAIQLFRMDCFKLLGDFLPMKYGGEDSMMCVKANSLKWVTRSFTDIQAQEQKFVGRAQGSLMKARNAKGMVFYDMGYHPLFFLVRLIYRLRDNPLIIGSFAELSGYLKLSLRKTPRTPSSELITFLRKEQMGRLMKMDSKR